MSAVGRNIVRLKIPRKHLYLCKVIKLFNFTTGLSPFLIRKSSPLLVLVLVLVLLTITVPLTLRPFATRLNSNQVLGIMTCASRSIFTQQLARILLCNIKGSFFPFSKSYFASPIFLMLTWTTSGGQDYNSSENVELVL